MKKCQENDQMPAARDGKGHTVLCKNDLRKDRYVIELSVIRSKSIILVELCQKVGSRETRFTIKIKDFNVYIDFLENMLTFSELDPRLSTNYEESIPEKTFPLRTEMPIVGKKKFSFEFIYDKDEQLLNMTSLLSKNVEIITIPVSDLEEFIDNCYDLLTLNHQVYLEERKLRLNYIADEKKDPLSNHSPIHSNNSVNTTSNDDASKQVGLQKLEVLNNLSPREEIFQNKTMMFEIVKGKNTFLRITEKIRGKIKDRIHVPIGSLHSFSRVIQEIEKDLSG